jgi:hypothetical protein
MYQLLSRARRGFFSREPRFTAARGYKLKAGKEQAGVTSTAYEVDAAFALLDEPAVAPGARD